jgi:hypothetical protein
MTLYTVNEWVERGQSKKENKTGRRKKEERFDPDVMINK